MNLSENTPRVATPRRLAVAALGIAVVSSVAVAATPASASRPDPYAGVVATTSLQPVAWDDPGTLLAQRKGLIDPRWWVRLGNVG